MTNKRFFGSILGFCLSLMFLAEANAMYAPTIGRFLSRDPIGSKGSDSSLYEFMSSAAINRLDSGVFKDEVPPLFLPPIDHGGNSPGLSPDLADPAIPIVPGTEVPSMPPEEELRPRRGPLPPCNCQMPFPLHRMRPPGKNGQLPLPGQTEVDCDVGKRVVFRYSGSCVPDEKPPCKEPCRASVCFEYVKYICERGNDGKTRWGNDGRNNTRRSLCSL